MGNHRIVSFVAACFMMSATLLPTAADARATHHSHKATSHRIASTKVTSARLGSKRSHTRTASTHRGTKKVATKNVRKRRGTAVTAKARFAYPIDNFFMWTAPQRIETALTPKKMEDVRTAFDTGNAGGFAPSQLVNAGVVSDVQPLYGGIFNRREPVKFIVLHSTETERAADAQRVIRSWNHGMRHPGAQYVVDRDGVIYQACDPTYATVHVDVFRTLNGVNNDNAVGIEIVRSGKQKYTEKQLDSVTHLVSYLQKHFEVADTNIVGHGQIQPSTRTDPVNFDWTNFAVSMTKLNAPNADVQVTVAPKPPTPSKPRSWWTW